MTTRTTYEMMSFAAPFRLPSVPTTIPAGVYEVATEDELVEELSFPVRRRLSTRIRLPIGTASYQVVEVNPEDLKAAAASPASEPT